MTDGQRKFGLQMLRGMQNGVLQHFEEARNKHYAESTWISGWLDSEETKRLESNGDEVKCSPESGEYFYKIIFKR